MWGTNITSAAVSPTTVEVQGSYLVTVAVEETPLTIAEADTMTLAEISAVPLTYMTERS